MDRILGIGSIYGYVLTVYVPDGSTYCELSADSGTNQLVCLKCGVAHVVRHESLKLSYATQRCTFGVPRWSRGRCKDGGGIDRGNLAGRFGLLRERMVRPSVQQGSKDQIQATQCDQGQDDTDGDECVIHVSARSGGSERSV